jgi:CheY-like chemotaxis protein
MKGAATASAAEFLARLRTPASRVPVFEVLGRLTPYDLETLVGNVESFPRGSRLEILVQPSVGPAALVACRAHLAALGARGIVVSVRRGDSTARVGTPSPAGSRSQTMSISEAPATAAASSPRRSVLVAEDDPDMRRLLVTLLRMTGYRVVEATDGADLLARLDPADDGSRPEPVDVIVSDVEMPQLSGLDLLAALRCSCWTTPVVLVTAFGDDDIRAEARALGAAALLDKPLDPEALRDAVAMAIASRTLEA